jgi:hypothetical protein
MLSIKPVDAVKVPSTRNDFGIRLACARFELPEGLAISRRFLSDLIVELLLSGDRV